MVTKVFDTTKVLLLTMVFEVFTDGLAGYKIHPNANSEALGCPHATLLTIATDVAPVPCAAEVKPHVHFCSEYAITH